MKNTITIDFSAISHLRNLVCCSSTKNANAFRIDSSKKVLTSYEIVPIKALRLHIEKITVTGKCHLHKSQNYVNSNECIPIAKIVK